MNHDNRAGFWAALFDFSFSQFIIPKIVSIAYIIALVAGGIWALFAIVGAFSQGFGYAFLALIVAIAGFFLYTIWVRILLEASVALIRIAQNTADILRNQNPPPPLP